VLYEFPAYDPGYSALDKNICAALGATEY